MSSVDMHPARILGGHGGFYIRVLFPKELLEHRCGVTKVLFESTNSPEAAAAGVLWNLQVRFSCWTAVEWVPPILFNAISGCPGAG